MNQRREENDYELPPLEKIVSPVNLSALIEEAKVDERLRDIIIRFADDRERNVMQNEALDYIEDHIVFQANTENSVYFAVYGPKGTGKYEISTTIAIQIIKTFLEEDGIKLHLKYARKPSEANTIFSEEVEKGHKVCMVLDERETEFGPDSQKEFMALVQLADTMREQRHALGMCAITRGELGKLLSRCELILRPIFCDRISRVNWCILYGQDLHGKNIVPKFIVGIELHPYEWLREAYRKMKHARQYQITAQGGRSGVDSTRIEKLAKELKKYIIDNHLENKVKTLKEVLLTEISGGRMLGEEERSAIVNRVYRQSDAIDAEDFGKRSKDVVISWVGDRFDWRLKVHTSLKDGEGSIKFDPEYADVWYITEIEGLNLHKDREKIEKLIGLNYQQTNRLNKKMNKRNGKFKGWIKYYRGEVLFESFLIERLKKLGWMVTKKPKVYIDEVEYEEDILIETGEEPNIEAVYINAKCGEGYRQYVWGEYKTTHIIATELKEKSYVVYFDYVSEVFSVFDASLEAWNAGSEETWSLSHYKKDKEIKKLRKLKADAPLKIYHSTPFLLSACLNGILLGSRIKAV